MRVESDILTGMKTAAFIPARYASTRLEGKPLAEICGRPMIEWVYERAQAAGLVDSVTVATDDERVLAAVASFGGRAVMTSSAHASGTERVAEAARAVDAGIIVNIQGDEPLIEPEMIDAAIRPMLDDPSLELCTLKTRITCSGEYLDANAVKVVTDADGFALYFSRSPVPYSRTPLFGEGGGGHSVAYKHIGLYVYRRDLLMRYSSLPKSPLERAEGLEQLRALQAGVRIRVVETRFNPPSVDTPEDLERVRETAAAHGRRGS